MSTPARGKRATIYTLGCRLNHAESAIIADRLQAAGYTLVHAAEPADVCVINTCTVTAEADTKSRKMIRAFIRRHPDAFVAVVGCYAQLAAEAIAQIPGVDLVLGTQDKLDVVAHVQAGKQAGPHVRCGAIGTADFRIEPCASNGVRALTGHRANLKIQDGCNLHCSYCIVPAARGPARSRAIDNLVAEARDLAQRGVQEIVVTGVNVGAYAFEGSTLLDVVDRLNEIEGVRRIRVSSIELNTIPDALLARMNDPGHALVPFLHIPLQSGSNSILERMRRPYRAEGFSEFVRRADAAVPGLCIGTDVLVGMPGETEEDFEATRRLIAQSPIAYAHVFRYSDRAGAPATHMDGKVDARTLSRRSAEMRRVSEANRQRFHERHLGATHAVLFEESEAGRWWGYTGNYIRVAACYDGRIENRLLPVILETDCGEHMLGRIVE